jgi:hypothetical protein
MRRTMSVIDAVDGSSTGTQVPWVWVLLTPPRFGGAKLCKLSRRSVSTSPSLFSKFTGGDAAGNVIVRRQLDHPYIIDGANTRSWLYWGYAFHVGAIVWGVLSLAAFVIGMIDVRNAIVRLAG